MRNGCLAGYWRKSPKASQVFSIETLPKPGHKFQAETADTSLAAACSVLSSRSICTLFAVNFGRTKTGGTMLGERIGDESGKITLRRTLPNPGGMPQVETSFEAAGSIFGTRHRTIGSYTSMMRPNGTVFGEGQGVVMSEQGEAASWVGQGIGTFGKDGSISYRGAIYYSTAAAKWARLNNVAAVFEYEVDAQGNTKAQIWEWK
jgi:hypothetical protein